MNEYADWTDERIDNERAQAEAEIDRLMIQVNLNAAIVANLKAEIDRRRISEYFDRHPDLPRFGAGDKIVVTQEMIDHYGGSQDNIGRVLTIKRMGYDEDGIIDIDLGTFARPQFSSVLKARRAYLAATQQEQPR